MKTCFSFITMIFVLTVSAWGQNTSIVSSDPKELGVEMDMMSGLLGSVLSSHFLEQNKFSKQRNQITNGSSWIDTDLRERFYLQGQGVVFMIPVSGLRTSLQFPDNDDIYEVRTSKEGSIVITLGGGVIPQVKVLDKLPDEIVEKMSMMPKIDDEYLLEQRRVNLLEQRKNHATDEQVFLQALDSVRTPLVDTLAQYGDSMYAVKPDEYINLVFQKSPAYAPSLLLSAPGSVYGTEIISVRKSWITDYKAGKMTLEEFRKKVLQ